MTEKSIFHARPSILASVEGSHLVQAVNPKFLDWLLEVEAKFDDLKTDCEGFRKLATESTLRGAENRKKLEAIKALAPKILSWMQTGVDWACSESREREAEKKMQAEHDETVKQFKELLGLKEAS